MFAIIKTGVKQFKVQKDDVLAVEKLEGKAGDKPMLDTGALYNDFNWEITER